MYRMIEIIRVEKSVNKNCPIVNYREYITEKNSSPHMYHVYSIVIIKITKMSLQSRLCSKVNKD